MAILVRNVGPHATINAKSWSIMDEDELARITSHVVLGYYLHADAIINGRSTESYQISARAKLKAIEKLSIVDPSAKRWHRDGWIFQIISWIAAKKSLNGYIGKQPHPKPAHHGFDGIWIQMDSNNPSVSEVLICEDKATENPRSTITSQVWPEFKSCEDGEKDSELISDITAVLERSSIENVEAIISNILLKDARRYRVSISATSQDTSVSNFDPLFSGYDTIVSGSSARRTAEVLFLENLRSWMDQFSLKIIEKIEEVTTNV